jgi:hypothetical protein
MLEVQVDARAVHAVEGLEDDRLRALAPPLPFGFGSATRGPERVERRLPGVGHLGERVLRVRSIAVFCVDALEFADAG